MRNRTVVVFSEEQCITNVLLGLAAAAGIPQVGDGAIPCAILVGCRSRLCEREKEAALTMSRARHIPILLIAAEGSEELAVQALRSGFANYLRLPLTAGQLKAAVDAALRLKTGVGDGAAPGLYINDAPETPPLDRMVGVSQGIIELKLYLARVAASSSNVLITGETGTGKELAADFIHRASRRASKPMVTINCAALPDSLVESELFGFERGAFTGAVAAQPGKFQQADGGTIFLDEIGDLTPWAQAKILRVIESGEIQRLASRRLERVNVRVIAATHRHLENDPSFRKDLFFRLNVARVQLPALRDRKDDILPLAESFRAEFEPSFGTATSFTENARRLLLLHHWPGNIRELRNIVEAAFIDPGPDSQGALDLPAPFRKALETSEGSELERILRVLSDTHWNKSRAADELRWSRMTLYRKLAHYKIARKGA